MTGVFLLHMGLVGSLVVYFSSKLLGLTNCMMPLVKDEMSGDPASWKVQHGAGYDSAESVSDPAEKESEPDLVRNC